MKNNLWIAIACLLPALATAQEQPVEDTPLRLVPAAAKTGDIGIWPYRVAVVQVVDPMNALLKFEWIEDGYKTVGEGAKARAYKTQIPKDRLFWLRGVSTEGITDGRYTRLPGKYKVTGTHQYITPLGGSNTVLLLEPHDDL